MMDEAIKYILSRIIDNANDASMKYLIRGCWSIHL